MTTAVPVADVLRIAAEIANSSLTPAYATSEAVQLAAAVVLDDPACLTDCADRLEAYADGVGLHGLNDDPDLVNDLHRWCDALREIASTPLTGETA